MRIHGAYVLLAIVIGYMLFTITFLYKKNQKSNQNDEREKVIIDSMILAKRAKLEDIDKQRGSVIDSVLYYTYGKSTCIMEANTAGMIYRASGKKADKIIYDRNFKHAETVIANEPLWRKREDSLKALYNQINTAP